MSALPSYFLSDGMGLGHFQESSTDSTSLPKIRAEVDCILNTDHKYWRDKLKIQSVFSLKVRGKALGR